MGKSDNFYIFPQKQTIQQSNTINDQYILH